MPAFFALPGIWSRLQLSLARHASLRGHGRRARRISRPVPYFAHDESSYFASDGAAEPSAGQRRDGCFRPAREYHGIANVVMESRGVRVRDPDGNWKDDLSGSC